MMNHPTNEEIRRQMSHGYGNLEQKWREYDLVVTHKTPTPPKPEKVVTVLDYDS
jgi:hypothetical protein